MRQREHSTYDKAPYVAVGSADEVSVGADAIAAQLRATGARIIAIEAYPGVRADDLAAIVGALGAALTIEVADGYLSPAELAALVQEELTDGPIFGRLTARGVVDFFEPGQLAAFRSRVAKAAGSVVVVGTGATL